MVHRKMKISPLFTHAQAILGVYDILLSEEYNWSLLKNVLALPSFIMAVNDCIFLEVHQSASIHRKSAFKKK